MSLLMSIEDKKSDILMQIKKNSYEINFGTSKAKFQLNDAIFNMEQGCKVRFDDGEAKCHVCLAAKLKQGFKNYCSFCGLRACEKCCYKVKQFKKEENTPGPPASGKICKHCDRKFQMRDMYVNFASKIIDAEKIYEAEEKHLDEEEQDL